MRTNGSEGQRLDEGKKGMSAHKGGKKKKSFNEGVGSHPDCYSHPDSQTSRQNLIIKRRQNKGKKGIKIDTLQQQAGAIISMAYIVVLCSPFKLAFYLFFLSAKE